MESLTTEEPQFHYSEIFLNKNARPIGVFYTNECHSVFNLKSNNDDVLEDNMIEIHVLELPKFKTTKINSIEEAWISFIKGEDILRKECDEIKKFDYILEKYWKSEMID